MLGEGGRKRVYLAHDTGLNRDVAIAVAKTEGLDADALTRVRREAQAMGQLGDHPNVVTIHDIGDEADQPYIVSQYMAGGDLAGLLEKAENHRLSLDRALRIAGDACRALEHAHSCGIVHRDLKPGNVWLTQDGTAKLGDFGLASALDRPGLTAEGTIVGTVAYMPPEQALGRQPEPRNDLYSLGCLLYELVSGRPPFLGDNAVAIISQHINTAPVAASWHNPELPRSLDLLILRLLAKAPEERPASAAAVLEALTAISSTVSDVPEPAVQEEANPLDRLAGGVFVGRKPEMEELRAALEDALSGRGRLLMLVGEPGIGKTRMAEELATYARLRDAQVLLGRCYESEGAPSFWPWVQAIRSYVHDRDPQELLLEMGSAAADIAQVVSEVQEMLPGLPPPPRLTAEQARFRMFDGITTFLKNASNRRPIVLMLDDLHWADTPSLRLLQFLAQEMRDTRLLVLGTYRDVEVTRQHPLLQTLAALARQEHYRRIDLGGLAEHDVGRFIEMTVGGEAPETLVRIVYQQTEGNPFFVSEIVRLLVGEGGLERPEEVKGWSVSIPRGVRDVVAHRLDRLSPQCNQILTVAAVIGREFALPTLERVSGVTGDQLLDSLEEALAARVIAEAPQTLGRCSFSHALIRETLQSGLSTTHRVRLHHRIGEALEDLYSAHPEPHLAELAYHFFQAAQSGADVDKATEYGLKAGDRALSQLAYEEAAVHYERAVQILELKEPDETKRCEALLALGEAQNRAGDAARAKETFQAAADIARKIGAPERLARAALGCGGVGFEAGKVDAALVVLLEDALTALGEGDSSLRARSLGRLAQELYFSEAQQRRASLSHEAVEVARRVGDTATLAYALNCRHFALMEPENLEERLAAANETLQLAERAGDKEMALEGHHWRLRDLLELGDIPAADLEIEAFAQLAEELRQPYYLWQTMTFRAMRVLLEGRFEEGERLAQQALLMGQRAQSRNAFQAFGIQMSPVYWAQGRLQDLEAGSKTIVAQYPAVPAWRAGLAFIYSEAGRRQEASGEFERLAANDFADFPWDAQWFIAMTLLSQVCAFLGDSPRAAILYKLLLPYARRNIVVGDAVTCYGSASHYLGLLAATMRRREEAALHFEAALEMNARMGARAFIANTQHEYARMLLDGGPASGRGGKKALALLKRALDIADELRMTNLVERALALKLKAEGLAAVSAKTSIDAVASAVAAERPDLRLQGAPGGTVTLLFSDIEGFTAMTERLGDWDAQEVLRAHNAIVREQLAAHDGFEVKSQGDGFMLAFSHPHRALSCAIAIQRALACYADERPGTAIRVRVGLHVGQAIAEAGDFFGRNVILAARIADAARGGEILVSSDLRSLTESSRDFDFDEGRKVRLKGLRGTHQVYRVVW